MQAPERAQDAAGEEGATRVAGGVAIVAGVGCGALQGQRGRGRTGAHARRWPYTRPRPRQLTLDRVHWCNAANTKPSIINHLRSLYA
jgi:hypothetical protein